MYRSKGFTLVELMVVLAVAAILLGVVGPSFRDMTFDNRITAEVNNFVSATHLARSEALKRGQSVLVQPIANDWDNGWTVVETVSGGATLLSYTAQADLNITTSTALASIRYTSRGNTTSGTGSLLFCDGRVGEQGRLVSVSITGRVSSDDANCP